jgi:polyisoprenoid-binding protein YceI
MPIRRSFCSMIGYAPWLEILAAATCLAAPEDYVIDPGHTFPSFEVQHQGVSTQRGRFNRTSGKVTLDPEAGKGSVDIIIDARSISTGNEEMDKLLRGKDFFNVEQFAEISYKAQSITFTDGKPEHIDGQLTLLGITKPVSLKVTSYACTRKPFLTQLRCGVDAQATIRRSEFGMTSLLSFTSDEVKLAIQAEAILPPKPQSLE